MRTRFAQVMLVLCLLTNIALLIADAVEFYLLNNLPRATEEQFVAVGVFRLSVSVLELPIVVLTIIAFLMWVHRINKNCHHFGAIGMEFTPGWAVGWYFIPIANLWKPLEAMKEMVQVSKDPINWEVEEASPAVSLWWATFVISHIGAVVAFLLYYKAEALPIAETAVMLRLGTSGLGVLACIFALTMVARLTDLQTSLVWGQRMGQRI